jgi:hypothetical protein
MVRPKAATNQDLDTSLRWYDDENKALALTKPNRSKSVPFFLALLFFPRNRE